jgi:polysaccharide pyruvyl transferase CsaB
VRVVVSGYYGAGNLGDEALLAGMLGALATGGVHDVTVLSADPSGTRSQHHVRATGRLLGLPRALLAADALVSGGGGLFQDVTSARSLRYYLGVVTIARRLGRPAIVFAQSLGPLSPGGRAAARAALAGVPLGLRDEPSMVLARELGLDAHRVGDTALLLSVPTATRRDAVVLVPRAGYPAATRVLADVGRLALAAGLATEVAALHHGVDAAELAVLRRELPAARVLDVGAPLAAARALAGAHLVVSARLHGLVLAAASGTAHAGLSYDPKVAAFAEDTGAPWWPVPRDDEEHATTVTALSRRLEAPPLDTDRIERARHRSAAGVAWLLRSLHERVRPARRLRS